MWVSVKAFTMGLIYRMFTSALALRNTSMFSATFNFSISLDNARISASNCRQRSWHGHLGAGMARGADISDYIVMTSRGTYARTKTATDAKTARAGQLYSRVRNKLETNPRCLLESTCDNPRSPRYYTRSCLALLETIARNARYI